MTKEDLLLWSNSTMDCYSKANLITSKLQQFFESNVCIPKGKSRHPYADEWHQAFEGTEIQKLDEHVMLMSIPPQQKWDDVSLPTGTYRIKPPEQVFEWQFMQIRDGKAYISDGWYKNIPEAFSLETTFWNMCKTIQIEETKRIRE